MTLRVRLAAFIAVAVGVSVAVVALFAYRFASNEARSEVDQFLSGRGPVVGLIGAIEVDEYRARGGRGPGPTGGILGVLDNIIREDAVAQFVEADGTVVTIGLTDLSLPVNETDLEVAAGSEPDYYRDETIGGVHYRVLTRSLSPGVAIQVGRDVTATDEILAGLRIRLTLLGAAGVLVAAALGWVGARRSLRPVTLLTDAAELVASTRQLEARIEVQRDDELGRLAIAFNEMLAALEDTRSSQQRLVTDASHELRTPLTSLRTNIELLAGRKLEESDRAEIIADLMSEVSELSHLVAEVVDLATIGREEEEKQEIDLGAIVDQAVERTRRRSSIEVVVVTEPTLLSGRPNSLLRAVTNLLDNAVKWGSEGGRIEVSLADGTFEVRDHGPGIPPADLPRIFERFYRSPEARSQPGSGLGLAIVAAVAADHGGTVFARNCPDGGAAIGFRLPAAA